MQKLLALIGVVALTVLVPATLAGATQPNPEHRVTICHATPPDTAANGWHAITPDIASVGFQHSGHQSEHDADIIPAYQYTDAQGGTFFYDGKNLDFEFLPGVTGADILAAGCKVPTETDDVCPNIDGIQAEVPDGFLIDPVTGDCVEQPESEPPTIISGSPPNSGPTVVGGTPSPLPVTGAEEAVLAAIAGLLALFGTVMLLFTRKAR